MRERLIEKEAARARRERGGEKGARLLPGAQALRRARGQGGERELAQGFLCAIAHLPRRDPERLEPESDFGFDGIGEELGIGLLEEGPYLGPEGAAFAAGAHLLGTQEIL